MIFEIHKSSLTHSKYRSNRAIKKALADNEAKKESIVALANAIVNPGAMMIKTFDTSIAEAAMEAPWSANQATFRTHLCRVHVAQDRHKVHRRVLL